MLKVEQLTKFYATPQGRLHAVKRISFEVPQGAFFTLLGPSGCGKTTTLRSIAGLERPRAGTITVDGTVVYSSAQGVFVAPNKRNFGMVFQSYAIWPHMNVFENAAFPLEVGSRRLTRQAIRDKVMRVLHTVGLDELAEREATGLSGGQQQRLALARALVMEPRLLLLDEPLSNLDAKLREDTRVELRELVKRLGITTVYVTHDQLEALTMSDAVAVMKDGLIVQEASPVDIYRQPKERFVASFIGLATFIDGRVSQAAGADGLGVVDTPCGALRCVVPVGAANGAAATIVLRPEDLTLASPDASPATQNILSGKVIAASFIGEGIEYHAALTGGVTARFKLHAAQAFEQGAAVRLQIPPASCRALIA